MSYTLAEAAQATGLNRSTLLRAIKSGRISGASDEVGAWRVEPVELHRVFPPAQGMPEAGPHGTLVLIASQDRPFSGQFRLRPDLLQQVAPGNG